MKLTPRRSMSMIRSVAIICFTLVSNVRNRSQPGGVFFQRTDLDSNAGFVPQQGAWNPTSRMK
jgi:hypothetical protein